MKVVKYTFVIVMLFATLQIVAQEKNKSEERHNKTKITKTVVTPNSTQAVQGEVSFSDGTNQLLRITDEGNFGAIQFQDGVPSDTDFKLYRDGSALHFNGSAIGFGGAVEINDLTDAKYDDESLFIGEGSGVNDDAGLSDGNENFNTGVGKNSMNANESGKSNVAFGSGALRNNITGSFNTSLGTSSSRYREQGDFNTAIGFGADYYNKTGAENTMIGYFAGHGSNASTFPGTGNVFIGFKAGANETGDDKLFIENSDSDTPLIYGNFNSDSIIVNGILRANNRFSVGTAKSLALNGVAIGDNTETHGTSSIAVGVDNLAWGFQSSAFGKGVKAMAYVSTVIGRYNAFNALYNQTAWTETDALFEIGNGVDDANRANAVTVLKNGNVGIGPLAPTASLHVDAVNGVVFDGLTTGSIPIEGSGSRMMWYQGKSAFRAGTAGSSLEWNDVNIGSHSTALNYHTKASGTYSFATGYVTEASGQRSTAMGSDTKASGLHSVAIGSHAEATGNFSTTIGSYVKASGEGTLFIGDRSHTSSIQNASNDNRFAARFANGYRFFTTSDLLVGAKMDAGDNSWTVISDSTKKENFKQVDGEDFLNKISNLKLTSWNYKSQNKSEFRHYGPMAQDFYSAFGYDGIGTIGNDTTIASSDFDGINLIAIKALEKRTSEDRNRIKNLEDRIIKLSEQNNLVNNINQKLIENINQIKKTLNEVIRVKNKFTYK